MAKQKNTKLVIFRNQWHFYTPVLHNQRAKLKKQSHLLLQQNKNNIPRNKFNQGGKRPVFKNYRTLKKETEEDKNKWEQILCSWTEELTSLECP